MSILVPYGPPGIGAAREAVHRRIFRGNLETFLPGGKQIYGAGSRDPGNSPVTVLRPGTLMGKITATGLYAPSFVGALTVAYTSGGTELTVSAAQAAELERLLGQAGTTELVAMGPPTAAGTVAVTPVTHSAINTTTGVITVTSLGVDKVAGTLLGVNDGRNVPVSFITDGWGVRVVDADGASVTVPFPQVPIAGTVDSSQLLPWPDDTSSRAYIVASLKAVGAFVFDHHY